jgi:hypothetical protein
LKIDLTSDEIMVLKLLVEASMGSVDAEPAADYETVGELLLKKFDLALAPQKTEEGAKSNQPVSSND